MPINMDDQFRGLPMADLIGGPLMSATEGQVRLANSTAQFIQQISFMPPPSIADRSTPISVKRSEMPITTDTVDRSANTGVNGPFAVTIPIPCPIGPVYVIPHLLFHDNGMTITSSFIGPAFDHLRTGNTSVDGANDGVPAISLPVKAII